MDDPPAVILASASPARAALLRGAGVTFTVERPGVDEDMVRESLLAEGADAAQLAESLAELKALRVAARRPEALVIGADQTLDCQGIRFDKPADRDHAKAHLTALRGKTHALISAVCVAQGGSRLWHHNARARLAMRDLTDAFIDRYLDAEGDAALGSVGAYRLEGLGAQLFTRIDGDYFTVLGLPLLPLLEFLRAHGVLAR